MSPEGHLGPEFVLKAMLNLREAGPKVILSGQLVRNRGYKTPWLRLKRQTLFAVGSTTISET